VFVVEFKNIGRNGVNFKKCWEEVTYKNFYDAVKPFLLSRDIEFSYNEETGKGFVIVGMVRPVGEFEIKEV
jgi:hypothetical protein